MIDNIWRDQPPGYYCLSLKSLSGKWKDEIFDSPEKAMIWLKNHRESGDLYFCTTTLSSPRRLKKNVQPSCYLWADLDEIDPRTLGKLKPTIAWMSSPGRYQALWKLDNVYDPDRIERVNKALAYKIGADQGSWILTKVLRIPGTRNHKYPKKPLVKLLWHSDTKISIDWLERKLKIKPGDKDDSELAINFTLDFKKVYKKYEDSLSRKIKRFLTASEAIKGKIRHPVVFRA